MNRRDTVLALLALGAAPPRLLARQPGKAWRVGFLALLSRPASLETHYLGAFAKGMRELGYVEGKNLVIEWRFADSKLDRLAAGAGRRGDSVRSANERSWRDGAFENIPLDRSIGARRAKIGTRCLDASAFRRKQRRTNVQAHICFH
jgi:hypothetical protein